MKIGNIECYGIIYKITNLINGKIYIGQTTNGFENRYSAKGNGIEKVYNHHMGLKSNNKSYNSYLLRSIEKYGFDDWEVIEIFDAAFSKKELDIKEKHYIKLFNTTDRRYGYNFTEGGANGKPTDEVIEKTRKTRQKKGLNISDSTVRKIKLAISCLMSSREICKMFSISKAMLEQIRQGNNFPSVCPELNDIIKNLKINLINERNQKILNLFDKGMSITEISNYLELSKSIVEKCVYKYRDVVEQRIKKRQFIYDEVMKLYNKGYNPHQITKMLNLNSGTAYNYINGKTNPYKDLPYKKIKNEDIPIIIDLYFNKNKTVYEIANKFKVSRNTIETIISHYKNVNTEVNQEIKKS